MSTERGSSEGEVLRISPAAARLPAHDIRLLGDRLPVLAARSPFESQDEGAALSTASSWMKCTDRDEERQQLAGVCRQVIDLLTDDLDAAVWSVLPDSSGDIAAVRQRMSEVLGDVASCFDAFATRDEALLGLRVAARSWGRMPPLGSGELPSCLVPHARVLESGLLLFSRLMETSRIGYFDDLTSDQIAQAGLVGIEPFGNCHVAALVALRAVRRVVADGRSMDNFIRERYAALRPDADFDADRLERYRLWILRVAGIAGSAATGGSRLDEFLVSTSELLGAAERCLSQARQHGHHAVQMTGAQRRHAHEMADAEMRAVTTSRSKQTGEARDVRTERNSGVRDSKFILAQKYLAFEKGELGKGVKEPSKTRFLETFLADPANAPLLGTLNLPGYHQVIRKYLSMQTIDMAKDRIDVKQRFEAARESAQREATPLDTESFVRAELARINGLGVKWAKGITTGMILREWCGE